MNSVIKTSPESFFLSEKMKSDLMNQPEKAIKGVFNGSVYSAKIIIKNYGEKIMRHYSDILNGGLQGYCQRVGVKFDYRHFGIEVQFEKPTELWLHDDSMVLVAGVHEILDRFGPVVFKNAYLTAAFRDRGHRNRFPHLNFHVDRSDKQTTHISLFTRNPFDEEQAKPRTSSTLFIANIVGHLQAVKEGLISVDEKGLKSHYDLFQGEDVDALIGELILEHAWNEPQGTGEISMQDNCRMLHASYYREMSQKGYRIGVRYVG